MSGGALTAVAASAADRPTSSTYLTGTQINATRGCTYDRAHHLTSWSHGTETHTYTWDTAGHRTSVGRPGGPLRRTARATGRCPRRSTESASQPGGRLAEPGTGDKMGSARTDRCDPLVRGEARCHLLTTWPM